MENEANQYQSGFAPIIVILAVVALAGLIAGAYYSGRQSNKSASISQPTTITNRPTSLLTQPIVPPISDLKNGEVAGWRIYRNDEYGFEFKYPPELILKDYSAMVTHVNLFNPQNKKSVNIVLNSFRYETLEKLTLKEAQLQSSSFIVSGADYNFGQDQSIKGKKLVVRRFLESGGDYDEEIIYFSKDNIAYSISEHNFTDQEKKLIDQILSTFKFIE